MAGDREEHPPAGASATNDSPERQGRVFKSVSHHMVMVSPVGCDARLDGVVVVWLMLLCMAHTEEWVSVRYGTRKCRAEETVKTVSGDAD